MAGLWDGFEGYATVDEAQRDEGIRSGMVFLDTNVLLDLYRLIDSASNGFLDVMNAYGDRLRVAHQVQKEFWANRVAVIRGNSEFAEQTKSRLVREFTTIADILAEWRERVGEPDEELETLKATLTHAHDTLVDRISDLEERRGQRESTEGDLVLKRLVDVLKDRVGEPPLPEQLEEDRKEGARRAAAKLAPGFNDAHKRGNPFGDYLTWVQSLRMAAEARSSMVIFVTRDLGKEDWVEDVATFRPFPILTEDARQHGAKLAIMSPTEFLKLSHKILDLDVSDETIRAVGSVARGRWTGERRGRWSDEEISEFFSRLADYDELRFDVLEAACARGGRIGRAEIYDLAGFEEGRTLSQFSRPITSVMTAMGFEPYSGERAIPMEAAYDNGPGRATHYDVLPEFVTWWQREADSEADLLGRADD